MSLSNAASNALHGLRVGLASIALFQFVVGTTLSGQTAPVLANDSNTKTPIKHVIVIIGENRSFDHVFATYKPKAGQSVRNLLSRGIIDANGAPGPSFSKAAQNAATDEVPDTFLLDPPKSSFPGNVLPAPLVGGPSDSFIPGDSLAIAEQSENGLDPNYYQFLVSGGTGLTSRTPDTRITDVTSLKPGPFQLTNVVQPLLMTPMPPARSIASTKCGSN